MKIQQIEYAVEVAKAMSFSQAAENLYVSQPNVSRAISSLEEELGYAIFFRTNLGISLTDDGAYFISKADVIVKQLRDIVGKKHWEKNCIYHIDCSFQHTCASEAFIKLCNEHIESDKLDISFKSSNVKDIIRDIYLNRTHLGIVGLDDKSLKNYTYQAKCKDIEIVPIIKLCMNVNMRKEHPLLVDGTDNFDFTKLTNYVHITYDTSSNDEYPGLIYNASFDINQKVITVSDKETRRRLVSSTDAFSIGCTLHPRNLERMDWVSITIPNTYCYVAYIKKAEETLDKIGKRYLELLSGEF